VKTLVLVAHPNLDKSRVNKIRAFTGANLVYAEQDLIMQYELSHDVLIISKRKIAPSFAIVQGGGYFTLTNTQDFGTSNVCDNDLSSIEQLTSRYSSVNGTIEIFFGRFKLMLISFLL
jgi:hypothetical protein